MTLSAFLTEAGLGVYVSTLAAQGYDDLQTVRGLDASDLATMCTSVNMLPGHIATLTCSVPQAEVCPTTAPTTRSMRHSLWAVGVGVVVDRGVGAAGMGPLQEAVRHPSAGSHGA